MILPAIRGPYPELELIQPIAAEHNHILNAPALEFLAELIARFNPQLEQLFVARDKRQVEYNRGAVPDYDPASRDIRQSDWQVAPIPTEVLDRRTEITGPINRKMVINALNSGAQVYMADFEDSTSPTWNNIIDGQVNLAAAVRRQIDFTNDAGKEYRLNQTTAVLMVRPRGLHLPERHLQLAGQTVPAALVDFGLYLFHNHQQLLKRGSRPYFYLPKLEHHSEAEWWDQVISWSEHYLGMEHGSVRVTVLLETLPAVFQMHEILHALKERMLGLNCGRWDYIFSYIKTFRNHPDKVLPDRDQVVMSVPFLKAYSQLLIQTCHRRGAFAMGGMAAQIPIRDDQQANELAMEKVLADKQREAAAGHDGTWVAHPALEPMAREVFDQFMSGLNQIERKLEDLQINAEQLLAVCQGEITEQGVRKNIRVAIQYMAAWLSGNGCVPIDHLMEDAATAEIGRSQLWQWAKHKARLDDGREINQQWLSSLFAQEQQLLLKAATVEQQATIRQASELLEELTSKSELTEFLTLPAYELLPKYK